MSCFESADDRRKKEEKRQQKKCNKGIRDEIRRDKGVFRTTHRLLLLGTSESGKSTVMKQMSLLANNPSEKARKQRVIDIHSNIREIVTMVLNAMAKFDPPLQLQNPESEEHARYILDIANEPDFDFPPEFFDHCFKLWNDPGMVQCYYCSNEYQLINSAYYFMEPKKFKSVSMPMFIPSNEDILHCRIMTRGIQETKFTVLSKKFHMIDVCGQQDTKFRKWIQCFNDVTAILFIVDCSSYHVYSRKNPSKTRLDESVELFESIWNNRWLKLVSIIVFLNKQDLLRQKILEGRFKIESYFPEYASYSITSEIHSEAEEVEEIRKAQLFFRSLFTNISEACPDKRHGLYTYFTIAVDSENIYKVWRSSTDIIQREHLLLYNLV